MITVAEYQAVQCVVIRSMEFRRSARNPPLRVPWMHRQDLFPRLGERWILTIPILLVP